MADSRHGIEPDSAVENEWDSTLQRIAQRLRKTGAAGTPHDLADQMAAIESRALHAEELLLRERHDHAERVREMEGKLRKLEPWLRKLKSEFEQVSVERDQLEERLERLEQESTEGSRAEVEVLERAVAAAQAERAAVVTELTALRDQHMNESQDLQVIWQDRIAEAERARDEAQAELVQTREKMRAGRRATDEVQQLRLELEQAAKTLSAHKAVARAAQEQVEELDARIEQLQGGNASAAAETEAQRKLADEMQAKLDAATAELAHARQELESVREELGRSGERVTTLEDVVAGLRADAEDSAAVREEAEGLRLTVDKLRQETSEAKQAAAKLREETTFARRNIEAVRDELDEAKKSLVDARTTADRVTRERDDAQGRVTALESSLADLRTELDEAATRLDGEKSAATQARSRVSALEERLEAKAKALEEAVARADAASEELSQVVSARETAEAELANARATNAALEAESAGLSRTLADERQAAKTRLAAVEANYQTQLEAAQTLHDAELSRSRVQVGQAMERIAGLEAVLDARDAEYVAEVERIRRGTSTVMSETFQRLADGMERVLGPQLGLAGDPDVDVAQAAESIDEWDRLLSDLEDLRGEVESFRDDEVETDPEGAASEATSPEGDLAVDDSIDDLVAEAERAMPDVADAAVEAPEAEAVESDESAPEPAAKQTNKPAPDSAPEPEPEATETVTSRGGGNKRGKRRRRR